MSVFKRTKDDRQPTHSGLSRLAGSGDGNGNSMVSATPPAESPALPSDQELAEYLWQFTLVNNYGNAVLASSGSSVNGTLEHTLTIATLVRAATSDACDRSELVRWVHAVDVVTGVITRRLEPVRNIYARETSGFATLRSA